MKTLAFVVLCPLGGYGVLWMTAESVEHKIARAACCSVALLAWGGLLNAFFSKRKAV